MILGGTMVKKIIPGNKKYADIEKMVELEKVYRNNFIFNGSDTVYGAIIRINNNNSLYEMLYKIRKQGKEIEIISEEYSGEYSDLFNSKHYMNNNCEEICISRKYDNVKLDNYTCISGSAELVISFDTGNIYSSSNIIKYECISSQNSYSLSDHNDIAIVALFTNSTTPLLYRVYSSEEYNKILDDIDIGVEELLLNIADDECIYNSYKDKYKIRSSNNNTNNEMSGEYKEYYLLDYTKDADREINSINFSEEYKFNNNDELVYYNNPKTGIKSYIKDGSRIITYKGSDYNKECILYDGENGIDFIHNSSLINSVFSCRKNDMHIADTTLLNNNGYADIALKVFKDTVCKKLSDINTIHEFDFDNLPEPPKIMYRTMHNFGDDLDWQTFESGFLSVNSINDLCDVCMVIKFTIINNTIISFEIPDIEAEVTNGGNTYTPSLESTYNILYDIDRDAIILTTANSCTEYDSNNRLYRIIYDAENDDNIKYLLDIKGHNKHDNREDRFIMQALGYINANVNTVFTNATNDNYYTLEFFNSRSYLYSNTDKEYIIRDVYGLPKMIKTK
jgi:hypothetical protein